MVSAEAIAADASAAFNPIRSNNIYLVREAPPLPTSTRSDLHGARKRKPSKAKPAIVSPSANPVLIAHMQGQHEMSESDLEKKRNKLGYQRISIACAHCRRRKIRCLVDENDPQQRCHNCIRLKKECLFYPVDQQNAMEEASQASSKAGGRSSTVASSPGEIGSAGRPFDDGGGREFLRLPSSIPSYSSEHSRISGLREYSQDSSTELDPPYQSHSPTNSPPMPSSEPTHSLQPSPNPMAYTDQQYWQFDRFGHPGDFAPFPLDAAQHHHQHHHHIPQGLPYASGDEQIWSPSSVVSTSYGHGSTYLTSIDRDLSYPPLSSQTQPLSPLQIMNDTTTSVEEEDGAPYLGDYGYHHRPPPPQAPPGAVQFWPSSHGTYDLSSIAAPPVSSSGDWYAGLAGGGEAQHEGQLGEGVFEEPGEYRGG